MKRVGSGARFLGAPQRNWLDEGNSGFDDELRLLRGDGGDLDPKPGDKDAVWGALGAKLPLAAGTAAGTKAAATKAAVAGAQASAMAPVAAAAAPLFAGGVVKSVVIGSLAAFALIAGHTLATSRAPSPSPIAVAAVPQGPPAHLQGPAPLLQAPAGLSKEPAGVSKEPAGVSKRPAGVSKEPAGPSQGPAGVSDEPSRAKTRAAAVARPDSEPARPAAPATTVDTSPCTDAIGLARNSANGGNGAAALRQLEAARVTCAGAREEEREVLAIRALATSGSRDAARARADAFLASRPGSMFAGQVRHFATP